MTLTEDQLYRAYRKLMVSTKLRVDNKIDIALKNMADEIKNSNRRFDLIYKDFVSDAGLDESLASTLRSSVIQQTSIGYGVLPTLNVNKIEAIATPQKLVEIFGKTNGLEISRNIYRSIEDTEKAIISTLKQSHADSVVFNKTVKNMETALDKIVVKQDQLSGYMQDLDRAGKRLIEVGDKQSLNDFKKAVKSANSQIDSLVDNKPFKQAQRANLNKVLRAVKKNSVDLLDGAIEKAVGDKYKSNMRRLVVTENGTAYEQAMYNERFDNENVTAVRFTLSSSHNFIDQCNVLAETDFYGLGRGVYPLKNQPKLVIHPNGVSYMVSLTKRQLSEAKVNSVKSVSSSDLAKAGRKAKLPKSQVKALQDLEQQTKTRIDSDLAIETVTK